MAIAYFTIPETGKIIYNGDTVILSEYPDTIAAVAYGWYKYEENAMNGWHFILLPSKSIIPAANVNLSLLTVVPNSSDDDRNPIPLNTSLQDIESRAFITLDSIAQRDKLIPEFMPNGRIVRVNDSVNHTTNYYEWNIETQSWDDWNIESEIDTKVASAISELAVPIIFAGNFTFYDYDNNKATVTISEEYRKRENLSQSTTTILFNEGNFVNTFIISNVENSFELVPGYVFRPGDILFIDGNGYYHLLPQLSNRIDYSYISDSYSQVPSSKLVKDSLSNKLDVPSGFIYGRVFISNQEPPTWENQYQVKDPEYHIGDTWVIRNESYSKVYKLLDWTRVSSMGAYSVTYYWFELSGTLLSTH